jgi:hypothetical protein
MAKEPTTTPLRSRPMTPELKAFVDRVIVPTLVKTYLERHSSENVLALVEEEIDNQPRSFISSEGGTK